MSVGGAGAEDGDSERSPTRRRERAQPHPARRQPPRGQDQGGGAALAMAGAPGDQDGIGALHRALQPHVGGSGHGPELVQVQHDQDEPGTADEEISGAERDPEPAPTLDPQQRGEIGPAVAAEAGSSASIPSTKATWPPEVVIRAMRARSRLLASGGSGTDDLAEPNPGGNRRAGRRSPSRSTLAEVRTRSG